MTGVLDLPELRTLRAGADHVDIKSAESDVTPREFMSAVLSWSPGWMRALFGIRAALAKLMGLHQTDGSVRPRLRPEQIPFTAGTKIGFWTVVDAAEDRFIVLEASDTHLAAHLALVAEPGTAGRTRFHAVTIVHDRNWFGPVYFAVVRPFHHVVVRGMVRAGTRG